MTVSVAMIVHGSTVLPVILMLPMYLLVLHVSDYTGYATRFLLFDSVAQGLIGRSASDLAEEVADVDAMVLPDALKALVGVNILFKIRISDLNLRNNSVAYRVDLVSVDAHIVQHYEATDIAEVCYYV
ncbi:unnamed protein product [Arabis nemorensis]|uniref:Uncharacterized protein n=1 Tax=Arabis nemorensis TaxID=586526 RepID=A0A565BCF7_9BRAS|nr:unnamed protein product [Arabis nemorensis]